MLESRYPDIFAIYLTCKETRSKRLVGTVYGHSIQEIRGFLRRKNPFAIMEYTVEKVDMMALQDVIEKSEKVFWEEIREKR